MLVQAEDKIGNSVDIWNVTITRTIVWYTNINGTGTQFNIINLTSVVEYRVNCLMFCSPIKHHAYRLQCHNNEKVNPYIPSTCKRMKERKTRFKARYTYYSLFKIFMTNCIHLNSIRYTDYASARSIKYTA